jgi:hypothetical protein
VFTSETEEPGFLADSDWIEVKKVTAARWVDLVDDRLTGVICSTLCIGLHPLPPVLFRAKSSKI